MKWVTEATYLSAYRIHVKFNDGTEGAVDLEETIVNDHRAIFKALKEREQFKRFKVDADTLVWENGLNLAPEYLYALTAKKAS